MPVVAPATPAVPPGRSDFNECDQVASPTVSITTSTRSGSFSPVVSAARAPQATASERFVLLRLVVYPTAPAATASLIAAEATPPPAPCTSTRSPALMFPCVNNIRYAVVHATGRHAASSNDNQSGLGTRLRCGTVRYSANAPLWRSESNARLGSSVSSPPPASGLPITG